MSRSIVALLAGLWLLASVGPALAKPNIIYILADDLGYAELGCYGQKIIRTPNIDRLAAEGVRFTQHYAGCAVCAPSRCALMTGMHMGHAAIRNNSEVQPEGQKPIPDQAVTLAELLKAQGYATGAMGKWGLGYPGSEGDPNRQGFDLFYGYNCQRHAHNHYPRYLWRNDRRVQLEGNDRKLTGAQYSQDLFVREALAFIRRHQDEPFFLYLPVIVPHLSIQVPEAALAEYKGKIPEEDYKHTAYLKHPTPRAGYAAMVTHMDRGVGQIVALVKELGLDENTLILFSSDNGPTYNRLGGSDSEFFHSAGPFRGLKGSLYEGGIRVPLVARWPGKIASGRESDHLSAIYDVLPTLCEAAGAKTPANIDGLSFLPTLLGEPDQPRHDHLYWEFAAYGGQQAVREGQWKAVRQHMKRGNLKIELYDLSRDIGERHDVAAKHPELVAHFAEVMAAEHTPNERFPLPSID
jgi:arylsulfatase